MGAYQSPSAKPAAVASNTPVTSDDEAQKKAKSGCNRHGGGQQNTLAKAMMAVIDKWFGLSKASSPPSALLMAAMEMGRNPETGLQEECHPGLLQSFKALLGSAVIQTCHQSENP